MNGRFIDHYRNLTSTTKSFHPSTKPFIKSTLSNHGLGHNDQRESSQHVVLELDLEEDVGAEPEDFVRRLLAS